MLWQAQLVHKLKAPVFLLPEHAGAFSMSTTAPARVKPCRGLRTSGMKRLFTPLMLGLACGATTIALIAVWDRICPDSPVAYYLTAVLVIPGILVGYVGGRADQMVEDKGWT
jgi:hypothetical protein